MAADPQATMDGLDALKLRLQGYTYREIADKLNVGNPGTIYRSIQRVLQKTAQEPADELRQLESMRLDDLQRRLIDMLDGEQKSDQPLFVIDRILKVQAQRAQLLGLNKPVVVEDDLGDQLVGLFKRVRERFKKLRESAADSDAGEESA